MKAITMDLPTSLLLFLPRVTVACSRVRKDKDAFPSFPTPAKPPLQATGAAAYRNNTNPRGYPQWPRGTLQTTYPGIQPFCSSMHVPRKAPSQFLLPLPVFPSVPSVPL